VLILGGSHIKLLNVFLYSVYTSEHTKHTWSKLRAHVVHVYVEYVCFVCASCMLPHINGILVNQSSQFLLKRSSCSWLPSFLFWMCLCSQCQDDSVYVSNYLRQGGYVFARVCLSVCQQDNSKSYRRIFLKFSGNVGNGKNYTWFNFGGDPETLKFSLALF